VRVLLDARRGKGEALRRSFTEARHEILVFIDAELVIPSRTRGGRDELHGTAEQLLRYLGSQLIMLAINYRWNVRLTDSQNGFRAIRARCRPRTAPEVQPDDHRAGDADARPDTAAASKSRVTSTSGGGPYSR
jgi:hypothetical protein